MGLTKMFVLEKKVDDKDLPYYFYAAENAEETDIKKMSKVNIVIPMGGSQSGFFRYPKPGEKILVSIDTENNDSNYLMGYLPDNPQDSIYTGENHDHILPDKKAGQFFRYKGPEDAPWEKIRDKDAYSEIGFYNEKTKWQPQDNTSYPEVTTMKIKSTGDIHQDTKNHHRTRAKRFELLVDCTGETDKENAADGYAFGDMNGDDSYLYKGDAHIRASNRIVIKAGKEIELRVGRSSIIISDTGIKIATRKTRSNIENGWDTVIDMNPRAGINMFGQKVCIMAGQKFELSEIYGGSISSHLGLTRITGFDIRLSTIGTAAFLFRGVINFADYVTNLVTMSLGAAKVGSSMGFIGSTVSSTGLRVVGGALANVVGAAGTEKYDSMDPSNTFLSMVDLILTIVGIVGTVIEMFIPEKTRREESRSLDVLYEVLALVEYGLLLVAYFFLITPSLSKAIFQSTLYLSSKAEIIQDANEYKLYSWSKQDINSLLAGANTQSVKEKTESVKEKSTPAAKGGEIEMTPMGNSKQPESTPGTPAATPSEQTQGASAAAPSEQTEGKSAAAQGMSNVKDIIGKLGDNKGKVIAGGVTGLVVAILMATVYTQVTAKSNEKFEVELRSL